MSVCKIHKESVKLIIRDNADKYKFYFYELLLFVYSAITMETLFVK